MANDITDNNVVFLFINLFACYFVKQIFNIAVLYWIAYHDNLIFCVREKCMVLPFWGYYLVVFFKSLAGVKINAIVKVCIRQCQVRIHYILLLY